MDSDNTPNKPDLVCFLIFILKSCHFEMLKMHFCMMDRAKILIGSPKRGIHNILY
jgi:hypothetical protein